MTAYCYADCHRDPASPRRCGPGHLWPQGWRPARKLCIGCAHLRRMKWDRIEGKIIEWFMRVVLVGYVLAVIVGATVWAIV